MPYFAIIKGGRCNAPRPLPARGNDLSRDQRTADALFATIDGIYQIQELDALLERVLREARRFVRADAGTLYLRSRERLFFSFVQNDTLFSGDFAANRYIYSSRSLPVDRSSLAGYVAATGDSLLIDDVYDIRSDVDYSFNPDFDEKSSYRTTSMLIVPLATRAGAVLGVLQLINALDEAGRPKPFSGADRLYIGEFARHAAQAIEKARLNRQMVLRMVELAALRDPFETTQHAKRVSAYATELYDRWARHNGVSDGRIRRGREILKTAALLHDIGKIAVSDTILKKREHLSDREIMEVRWHTILGARLFRYKDSPWERVAREVALNHHERWDGTGYPGHVESLKAVPEKAAPGKRGKEIPLSARIVAIADVYDALISERIYKEAWEEQRALAYLDDEAGRQFDPELVSLFLDMQDIVGSIRRKYAF